MWRMIIGSIFETPDLTANPEILWFKMYDGDQMGNSVNSLFEYKVEVMWGLQHLW